MCTTDVSTVLPIRLVGGSTPSEGRVEVLFRGEWGTVCNDEWDQMDANVVCRQLGYLEALSAPMNVPSGSGAIWFDNLRCTGDEIALSQCPSDTNIGAHNCLHSEDVSVKCRGVCVQRSNVHTMCSFNVLCVCVHISELLSKTVSFLFFAMTLPLLRMYS